MLDSPCCAHLSKKQSATSLKDLVTFLCVSSFGLQIVDNRKCLCSTVIYLRVCPFYSPPACLYVCLCITCPSVCSFAWYAVVDELLFFCISVTRHGEKYEEQVADVFAQQSWHVYWLWYHAGSGHI